MQSLWGSAMLGLVVLSRLGLYAFDIAEAQLMQTEVPESLRGAISTQASPCLVFLSCDWVP